MGEGGFGEARSVKCPHEDEPKTEGALPAARYRLPATGENVNKMDVGGRGGNL
jgi:hypothetical protein